MANEWLSTLGLNEGQSRMPQMANPNTLGPQFFTPSQSDFREVHSRGFDGQRAYPADPRKKREDTGTAPADANCGRLTRHPDGTVDCVRLEATADGWIDSGGKTPRDMKVVAW